MVKIAQTTNLKQTWRESRDISEVAYLTFLKRVKAGMSIEQALTSENKQYKPSTPMGEYWAENKHRAKVSYNTYRQRVAKGMTFEEAVSEENYWKTDIVTGKRQEMHGHLKYSRTKPILTVRNC